MSTYICKCGEIFEKNVNPATTGNRMPDYGPEHRCWGCPYVYPLKTWDPLTQGNAVTNYECRGSKEIRYDTTEELVLGEKNVGRIFSLDLELLHKINDYADSLEGIEPNRYAFSDSPSNYCDDGRYKLTITPSANNKGIQAKQQIFQQFFFGAGARKDMTPEQEKEMILNRIIKAKAEARGLDNHQEEPTAAVEPRKYKNRFETLYFVDQIEGGKYKVFFRSKLTKENVPVGPIHEDYGSFEEAQSVLDEYALSKGYEPVDTCEGPAAPAQESTEPEPPLADEPEQQDMNTPRRYVDDKSRLIFVREGFEENTFIVMYQKKGRYNDVDAYRLKCKDLDTYYDYNSAQADLDAYAARKGWPEYIGEKFRETDELQQENPGPESFETAVQLAADEMSVPDSGSADQTSGDRTGKGQAPAADEVDSHPAQISCNWANASGGDIDEDDIPEEDEEREPVSLRGNDFDEIIERADRVLRSMLAHLHNDHQSEGELNLKINISRYGNEFKYEGVSKGKYMVVEEGEKYTTDPIETMFEDGNPYLSKKRPLQMKEAQTKFSGFEKLPGQTVKTDASMMVDSITPDAEQPKPEPAQEEPLQPVFVCDMQDCHFWTNEDAHGCPGCGYEQCEDTTEGDFQFYVLKAGLQYNCQRPTIQQMCAEEYGADSGDGDLDDGQDSENAGNELYSCRIYDCPFYGVSDSGPSGCCFEFENLEVEENDPDFYNDLSDALQEGCERPGVAELYKKFQAVRGDIDG